MNKQLSICIPTYNRAKKLEQCIRGCIGKAAPLQIPIYVSDNGSTDQTQEVVAALQKEYPHIIYSRNETNKFFAYNINKILNMPDTEYIWLMGDDDLLCDFNIEELLSILKEDAPDLVLLNGLQKGRVVFDIQENVCVRDRNELLANYGYQSTWMSLLVVKRALLTQAKFYDHNFEHTAEIFNALPDPMKAHILSTVYVREDTGSDNYTRKTIELFVHDIATLSDILHTYDSKARAVFCHKFEYPLTFLLRLRADNFISSQHIAPYTEDLKKFSEQYYCKISWVCMCPRFVLIPLYKIYTTFFKKRKSHE